MRHEYDWPRIAADAATMTIAELAKEHGVPNNTMIGALWRRGIRAVRKRPGQQPLPTPITFRSLAPTMTQKQCRQHYGVHSEALDRWERESGVACLGSLMAKKADTRPAPPSDRHAEAAADHLRRFAPVFRCTSGGRADQKGDWYCFGRTLLTPQELIARAKRKGFDPDAWQRVA